MNIQTVGIVGAGTMGAGIAQTAVLANYNVILFDLTDELLQKGCKRIRAAINIGIARDKIDASVAEQAKNRLTITTALTDMATADLIIEAAPEEMHIKQDLFAKLDEITPVHSILASNTSSLSITALAAATKRPFQVIGLHFFNPAPRMQLVEVIRGDFTNDETVKICQEFVTELGKTAVLCQDTPGFIVNRVARPFYGEAYRLLGEKAADIETIDALIKSIGFRMGPFELIDLIGLDINLATTQSIYNAYFHEPKYRPHPIQRHMVESGQLGRKSKKGFYKYPDKETK